jgi:hypothetical protein
VESKEKILTLDKAFVSSEIPFRKIRWIFDIKESGISQRVRFWLENKNIPENQLFLFGDFEVLQEVLQVYNDCPYRLGYTTLFGKNWKKMLFNREEIFRDCEKINCKLLVVPIFFVTKDLVGSASERGIDVWCYDSNDVRDLKYATGCGVKGVIGDYPEEMMNAFNDLEKGSQPSVR